MHKETEFKKSFVQLVAFVLGFGDDGDVVDGVGTQRCHSDRSERGTSERSGGILFSKIMSFTNIINPTMVAMGPISIRWYGLFLALGVLCSV